eukprot:scpid32532/ scgid11648/ 
MHLSTVAGACALLVISALGSSHAQAQTRLLDETIVEDRLAAGGTKDYTFDVQDVQNPSGGLASPGAVQPDLIRLMVSPCNGGNNLRWQVLHEGEVDYEFNPSDPANNNNIENNRMVALGKRKKRQAQAVAPPRPLPTNFQYEKQELDEFTGLGKALTPQTGLYVKPDASDGKYSLRLTNNGAEPIKYMTLLSRRQRQTVVPELPDVQNVKVEKVRPKSIHISWRPVHGTVAGQNSGVDYTAHAFPVDELQSGDNVNSECGVKRIKSRRDSTGKVEPAGFPTSGSTSAMFNDLQPDTLYRMNVLAMNTTTGKDIAYIGVEARTSPAGLQMPLERDWGNLSVAANSKQIYTLDLTNRPISANTGLNQLGVTVFPCDGLVTWSMTRDGIDVQAFQTAELGDDDAGGEIDDSVSDDDSSEESADDRKRRQNNDMEEADGQDNEMETTDAPDNDNDNEKMIKEIRQQRAKPLPAGTGNRASTGGQTVFSYNELMKEPALYQLSVYNTQSRPIRFDMYASTKDPLDRPYPVLPVDQQVKAVTVDKNYAEIGWQPSASNDPLAYCISAVPRQQITAQYVQSSTCGLRRAPVYTPPPPIPDAVPVRVTPNRQQPPARPDLFQSPVQANFPIPSERPGDTQQQQPNNNIVLPGAAENVPLFDHPFNPNQFASDLMPLVQRTRGCGTDTRGRLGALSEGVEYNVEVLAINTRTNKPLAYTSALVKTGGGAMLSCSMLVSLLLCALALLL